MIDIFLFQKVDIAAIPHCTHILCLLVFWGFHSHNGDIQSSAVLLLNGLNALSGL
jgi:hypothetical protein